MTTNTYVAVGFKVNTANSIFYFKDVNLEDFLEKLKVQIRKKEPDFISLRIVKTI